MTPEMVMFDRANKIAQETNEYTLYIDPDVFPMLIQACAVAVVAVWAVLTVLAVVAVLRGCYRRVRR